MLFSSRNTFCRCALASLTSALLLIGCGGGGGGGDSAGASGAFPPSSTLAEGSCTIERQKAFLRSYLDEVYLWYNEIPSVNAADYTSVTAYFDALLVRTPDAAGEPKDEFSAVRTTGEADALMAAALPNQAVAVPPPPRCDLPGGSVPMKKVVNSQSGRKVGYVLFNDHHEGAQGALIDAFKELEISAVQDLVLDMRCNSGGFLYVAQAAASMIAGAQNDGRVFEQLRYNDKREADSRAGVFRFTSTVQSPELSYPRYFRGHALPQLSLPRVYVLSSELTCSASESIVNGLRGIDVEVILVGQKTCGKPYGFQRKDNCGLSFFPIEFQGYNEKGFGDYISGFTPTCTVTDDGRTALGAPEEKLLAAALSHADTGSCPPGAAMASSLPQAVDLRFGGRSSAANPVGGRLVLRPNKQ